MIGRWIKQSDKWKNENKRSKHIGSERKTFYSKVKDKLYNWITVKP